MRRPRVYDRGTMTGAAMLELVALVTAAVLTPAIVVLGLFRLAGLKRVEDLQPSPEPEVDEWAASHERPLKMSGTGQTGAGPRF